MFPTFHAAGRSFRLIVIPVVCLATAASADQPHSKNIGFNRDIRPILSDSCSKCHGPDKSQREADLRLDTEAGIFADRDDYRIVVPGKPEESELIRRITSNDPDEQMPPPDSDLSLTKEQIELIRSWVQQGAKWEQHWSFIAPRRPKLPAADSNWTQNPVDNFIWSRLDRENLAPSHPAGRVTVIRRVTLDLTGLPPTPDEVESFEADKSPDAYDRLVDRLLASPRYGERMAIRWLDLARYADTSGYQNDGPRTMWRWRDWVINAYNAGMPFDRFTVEQLAGDLLTEKPDLGLRGEVVLQDQGRLEQLIATAFNRNHRGNAEGGIIPEEYQVEYVVDRVETTATAWLGLTLGCARCHDHKYDPFTQKEFYGLFAYFNNIPEYGRAIKEGNSPPFIKAPTEYQQHQLAKLDKSKAQLVKKHALDARKLRISSQRNWESSFDNSEQIDWTFTDGLVARYTFDETLKNDAVERGEAKDEKIEDGDPIYVSGKQNQAAEFDGKKYVDCGDVANFTYFDKFSITAWVYPQSDGTIVSRMTREEQGAGYYLHLEDGRLQINLVKRWLDDSIRVESEEKLAYDRWHHIAVVYDGTRIANGITLFINGKRRQLRVLHDFLNQSFTAADEPLRIGAGSANFQGRIDDVRIYSTVLSPPQVAIIATPESINDIVATPREKRAPGQKQKLGEYFLRQHAPKRVQQFVHQVRNLKSDRTKLIESMPTVMVMHEMNTPRQTHVLLRGQYDKPTERALPGVPVTLSQLPEGAEDNRLGLARWLIDPANPLTGRVAVNRYWQMFFGNGLVSTMEDFGVQGARPTHPDLLDWLSTEFSSGWDVKRVHKLISTSATYQQSSQADHSLLRRDPKNELYARGPRLRLPAELIRDQALAAAGLLTNRLGGPSAKIYQPDGLWKEIATDTTYEMAAGAELYRRSLYAYWKRTVSPPSMATFDAPSREACIVRRPLTNTPLQALSLLNDVMYFEAARVLAERVMNELDAKPGQRIRLAFRLITARDPNQFESKVLLASFKSYLAKYQANSEAASKLVAVGQSKHDESLDVSELAAYATVASLILNLDETVTKE